MKIKHLITQLLTVFGCSLLLNAQTIYYVNGTATGNNNGNSWADAFTGLKQATDLAGNGDEIWIAQGVYTPDASDRNVYFTLGSGVSIYGGFNGTETQLSERDWRNNITILSGDLQGNDTNNINYFEGSRFENSYKIIYVVGNNTVIDGLTLTGAHANHSSNGFLSKGSAIYKKDDITSLTIKNCIIEKNVANREGSIRAHFDNGDSTMIIENCIFNNNFSRYGTGFFASTQNLSTKTLQLSVINSLFYENTAGNVIGSDGFSGSSFAVFSNQGTINTKIVNCTFADNMDSGSYGNDKGTVIFRRLNNNASCAINVEVYNSIFYNNYSSSTYVVNTQAIGLINRPNNLLNSLTFNNNNSNQTNLGSKTSNLTELNGINQNPLFNDALADDYSLYSTSQAIDAGDNTQIPLGITTDLIGNARISNTVVDMGCYEFGSVPLHTNSINSATTFVAYPNPVDNVLNLEHTINITAVRVYNLLGQEVINQNINTTTTQIDMSKLNTGTYMVSVTVEDTVKTIKVIKK